jgi:hypothetical protein
VVGATISKVVSIDRGDYDVTQPHVTYRLSERNGLVRIERQRPAVCNIAEGATPCAKSTHDHEGRGPITKALPEVGAICFLADSVQLVLTQDFLESRNFRRAWKLGSNPSGLW